MTAQMQLKRLAVTASVALMGLSAHFNTAAQTAPVSPPLDINAAKADSRIQDAQLRQLFEDLDTKAAQRRKTYSGYKVADDPETHLTVDAIKMLVQHGANPNAYDGDGLTLFTASNLTAFHAAILLSLEAKRSDLVQAFLDAGAKPALQAPDGWSGMDYAITGMMESQRISRSDIENAVQIITMMKDKGGKLEDAAVMIFKSAGALKTYANLARNIVGLDVLHRAKLVTDAEYDLILRGSPDLPATIKTLNLLTPESITANGGQLTDYAEDTPGGPEPYKVQKGDTIWSLARRFQHIMEAGSVSEATLKIAALNKVTLNEQGEPSRMLTVGEILRLPVATTTHIRSITAKVPLSLMDLAKRMAPNYYNQGLNEQQIARDLARVNGLDITRINEAGYIKKGDSLYVGLRNDGILQFKPKTPPPQFKTPRDVDVLVIEPQDEHGKNTFRVAVSTGYAINPKIDINQFHALDERLVDAPTPTMSKILRILLQGENSPLQDRFIFSHSMAYKLEEPDADKVRSQRPPDSIPYESTKIQLGILERTRPIIFNAAGNFWPKEGRYIQSYTATHSPHSVIVGAVGQYRLNPPATTGRVISPYSTHGADICGILPTYLKEQMEGTSFSTPMTAALYRQMSEWYGDTLSFEEIMAAAFMTADRNILDYADQKKLLTQPPVPDRFATIPAAFRSNGGGLPINERCGAGALNADRWQQALDTLMELKTNAPKDNTYSVELPVGTPTIVSETLTGGKAEYIYNIEIPADMTLGKLTFLLPQEMGKRSEIMVRTPSGYEKHMPKALTDIISTFAFAYEDVKAKRMIQIITTEKLAGQAAIVLRGNAPGNAIAKLRDQLQQQGILPPANRTMEGDVVKGPLEPLNVLQQGPITAPDVGPEPASGPHMPSPSVLPSPQPKAPPRLRHS